MAEFRANILRWLPLILILVTGSAVSFGIASYMQYSYEERVTEQFHIDAQERIKVVHNALERNIAMLRSIVAFFNASQSVSRQEFDTMTSQLLKDHPDVRAISWLPRVAIAEREFFEQDARLELPDFSIREMSGDDIVAAGEKNEYFPVYYIKPLVGHAAFLGLDVSSLPQRQKALLKARENEDIVVSERTVFLKTQNEPTVPGVIFVAPVYQFNSSDHKAPESLQGFLSLGLPLKALIEKAIEPLKPAGVHVIVRDLSAEQDNLLYAWPSRLVAATETEILDVEKIAPLATRDTFAIGKREWEIKIVPARGYYLLSLSVQAILVLGTGILITLLIAAYIFKQITQNENIRRQVRERTHELALAKEQRELLLHSISEGVIGLDKEGFITFANPHAALLLQYRTGEMIERKYELFFRTKDEINFEDTYLRGKSFIAEEGEFWRQDDKSFPVEFTAAPLHDGNKITGAVVVFRDIRERKQYEEGLKFLAQYDTLTGIANRMLFSDMLKKALAKAERINAKVGLLYFDLNDFKTINDTMGHAAGDALLIGFANRVSETLRVYDTIARLGGDEFTVIADHINTRQECEMIQKRIENALRKSFVIDGKEIQAKTSIGIALFPDDGMSVEELLSAADTAMYENKKENKKQVK